MNETELEDIVASGEWFDIVAIDRFDVSGETQIVASLLESPARSTGHEAIAFLAVSAVNFLLEIQEIVASSEWLDIVAIDLFDVSGEI